jgi:toxin-antitoxin system PIN domain toxin
LIYLLDVNVVIALLDPMHVHHAAAHSWFSVEGKRGWATCPIVQNGALRIFGGPGYTNSAGSPAAAVPILQSLLQSPNHHFWPDDLGLLDSKWCDSSALLTPKQVTDTYLLALAASHGGKLATFDRRVTAAAVPNGDKYLHLLQS